MEATTEAEAESEEKETLLLIVPLFDLQLDRNAPYVSDSDSDFVASVNQP